MDPACIIFFYRFNYFIGKKEGFTWSPETIFNFIKLENTINRGIVFDTIIAQQQSSEKEVEYFIKHQMWPWNNEVIKLYKEIK